MQGAACRTYLHESDSSHPDHALATEVPPPASRTGRCLAYGAGITYWPLGEMVKAAAGISDDDPLDEAFEKLLGDAPPVLQFLVRQFRRRWNVNEGNVPEQEKALAAFMASLAARLLRALDEGEPIPDHPHRLIEENLWRAIRYGLAGDLIELDTGDVRPARAVLEDLAEWVLPSAEEIGAAPYLSVPAANAAERQLARYEAGASLRAIYADEAMAAVRA